MADLSYSQLPITDVEVAGDQPITAALFTKLGGAINYLLDRGFNYVDFTTPGATSWTCPANTNFVLAFGCGGGGGGGGGYSRAVGIGSFFTGGAGGSATLPLLLPSIVVPSTVYPIVIGAGGTGGAIGLDGDDGADTTFNSLIFPGAPGGKTGVVGNVITNDTLFSRTINPGLYDRFQDNASYPIIYCGSHRHSKKGGILVKGGEPGQQLPEEAAAYSSPYSSTVATNGTGSFSISTFTYPTGGGGGGTGLGPGGNGGNGNIAGSNAPSTSYGAGGGGGGSNSRRAGGNGAGGFLRIIYFGTP